MTRSPMHRWAVTWEESRVKPKRLIIEGVDPLDHPGIVYRGPSHDRRAALAGGPDVWEIIA